MDRGQDPLDNLNPLGQHGQEQQDQQQQQQPAMLAQLQMLQQVMQQLQVEMAALQVQIVPPAHIVPGDDQRAARLKAAGIKLPLPPKFSRPVRDQNSRQWIRAVEYYGLQLGLPQDDNVAIATSLLEPPAKTWWITLLQQIQAGIDTPILTWADWVERFMEAFPTGDLPWLARAQLLRPVVIQKGSVMTYVNDLTQHFLEAGPSLSDEDRRWLFWAGAKQPIKDKLDLTSNASLKEMIRTALEYDNRWLVSQKIGAGLSNGASGSGNNNHNAPTPMELGNVRFAGSCYNCGKAGHKAKDCWRRGGGGYNGGGGGGGRNGGGHRNKQRSGDGGHGGGGGGASVKKQHRNKGKKPRGSSHYSSRQGQRVHQMKADDSPSSSSGSGSSDSESENGEA